MIGRVIALRLGPAAAAAATVAFGRGYHLRFDNGVFLGGKMFVVVVVCRNVYRRLLLFVVVVFWFDCGGGGGGD